MLNVKTVIKDKMTEMKTDQKIRKTLKFVTVSLLIGIILGITVMLPFVFSDPGPGYTTVGTDIIVDGVLYTADLNFTSEFWYGGSNRTDLIVNPTSEATLIVESDGTDTWMTNCSTGQRDATSTNASQIINWAFANATGESVFVKAGVYQCDSTILLPRTITVDGVKGQNETYLGTIFNYTGTGWAMKTDNYNNSKKRGYLILEHFAIQCPTAGTFEGGLLLDYLEFGFIDGIGVETNGSPEDGSAGIKYAEVGANQVQFRRCETGGFDYGFWITGDWVTLDFCNSYTANTAFQVDHRNQDATRPIETVMHGCMAYLFDEVGYNISYAHAFQLLNPAVELTNGTARTGFFIDNGFGDTTVKGSIIDPGFHDTDPATKYDFDIYDGQISSVGTDFQQRGTQICANNEWIPHYLAGTPDVVLVSSGNCTYDGVPVIVNYIHSSLNSTHFQANIYWTNGTVIADDVILVSYLAEYKP